MEKRNRSMKKRNRRPKNNDSQRNMDMTERNDSFNSDKLREYEEEYADAMEEEGERYNQRMGGKSRKQKHSRKCKKSRRKSLFTRFF